MRVREAADRGAARLASSGCETPRLDAELLLAFALGVDRARLVLDAREPVPEDAARRFEDLLARRAEREPVAYIVGSREFRRISLAVDPRVLIPRPESELLVESALGLETESTVVDVGTGSGAVALALKDERPDLAVLATDVSGEALCVARANAARLGLEVEFRQGDLLAGVSCEAVVANLPYVADGETLAPEIERYEPAHALFGGPDGLDPIRRLLGALPVAVTFLSLEVGAGQAAVVSEMVRDAGLRLVELVRDLAGHERVVVGRR